MTTKTLTKSADVSNLSQEIVKIKISKRAKFILSSIMGGVKDRDFLVDNRSDYNTYRKMVSSSVWDTNFMDGVGESEGKVAQIVWSNLPPQFGSDIIRIDAGIDKLMQMQLLFFETGAYLVDHPDICIGYPNDVSRNSALVLGNVVSSFVRHSKLKVLSHGYYDSVTFNLNMVKKQLSSDSFVVLRQWEDVAQIECSQRWKVKLSYIVINFTKHQVDVYNAGSHIINREIDEERVMNIDEVGERNGPNHSNTDMEVER